MASIPTAAAALPTTATPTAALPTIATPTTATPTAIPSEFPRIILRNNCPDISRRHVVINFRPCFHEQEQEEEEEQITETV